jgi:hypothetical protein
MTGVEEQKDETPVTILSVFKSREFRIGVEDVRAGRPPRFDDPIAWSWAYERGRLFAAIAPMRMPLRVAGKVNLEAYLLLRRLMIEKAIL